MNTNGRYVITIAKELGSGGRTVGSKLAERLGVKFYDKAVIDGLIDHFHLTTSEIEKIKGKEKNWFDDFSTYASFITMAPRPEMFIAPQVINDYHIPTSDELFQCEKEILLGIAETESCVIAGRSGFLVLKDHPNMTSIYIGASKEKRIKRVMEKRSVSAEEAEEIIATVDKSRENFVKRYSGASRYDLRNYDLVLSMDSLSEDDAVECIMRFLGA